MPRKVGSESLCQYWLMAGGMQGGAAPKWEDVCARRRFRSELVSGCGAMIIRKKNPRRQCGANISPHRRFILLRPHYGYQGTRINLARSRRAPGLLGARAKPPPAKVNWLAHPPGGSVPFFQAGVDPRVGFPRFFAGPCRCPQRECPAPMRGGSFRFAPG